MYIKIFGIADTKEECKKIYEEAIEDIKQYIDKVENLNIEQYWKFDDIQVLTADISLNVVLTEKRVYEFLETISDTWDCRGYPAIEVEDEIRLLASKTAPNCNYIKEDIEMIIINFHKSEVVLNSKKIIVT